jgi:hypothetical protein
LQQWQVACAGGTPLPGFGAAHDPRNDVAGEQRQERDAADYSQSNRADARLFGLILRAELDVGRRFCFDAIFTPRSFKPLLNLFSIFTGIKETFNSRALSH